MNRRALLKAAAWLTMEPLRGLYGMQTAPQFSADPFAAGVASGDPTRSSVVLWTRLIPDPHAERGWQHAGVPVDWQIATDEGMKHVVRWGREVARPGFGHSVHVDATGLDSNRWYWYRFRAGAAESPIGRTKTAPASPTDRIRFAFASCQQYQAGYFTPYSHLVGEDLDVVVFLGDYIYETVTGTGPRPIESADVPTTLKGYRERYALYKSDANLREAHRLFPWIITLDDHEVQNDYAADVPPDTQSREDFLVRRAAAYQAHYEWTPMPKASLPKGPSERMHRTLSFGPLANFIVLDGRQHRSDQVCGEGIKAPCAEFLSERTMLGAAQERWLEGTLRGSRSQWNIIANQVMMSAVDQTPGPNETYFMDHWAGYETARRRFVSTLASTRVQNPVVITGDIHSNWVGDLKLDNKSERSPIVGTELVGTSISSGGDGNDQTATAAARVAENPQIKFHNNQRGYVRCELSRQTLTADFRVVEKVSVPESNISTRASFIVENGRPGAHKA